MHSGRLSLKLFPGISILVLLYISIFSALGQDKGDDEKYRLTDLKAKVGSSKFFAGITFEFPNLNKKPYFNDSKTLKKIQKLERQKKLAKVMPLLEDYIMNFGVQNFYKDTKMLWRMAQLYETQGEKEKAKAMYKLVLKHHRNNVLGDTVMHYYRAMERDDREVYIPLDFYYRLVEFRRNIDTLRPPTGVLLSMGPEVNGKFPDYGPTVAHNEDTLIFTSRRTKRKDAVMQLNPTANEDLYLSQGIEGYWDEAVPMKDINTQYNEGSAILSKDGKTLFFVRCNAPGSYGDCDLYMAKLTAAGTWSDIKNLGAGINSVAWDSQPALSFTEDTLYFSSNRNGGFGLSDLYYTTRLNNGAWSRAYNLGPVINTKNNEVSPFMHPSYHVLYFSSNGQLMNFGDFDIYKTYTKNGQWIEPLNVGPLVNGKGSEYYFSIDKQSKNLYYARSEESDLKNLDLYSFPLPMEAQPLATSMFSGSLKDSAGNAMKGIVSVIDLDNGIEVFPKNIRDDGTFDFNLIKDNNYLLIIQGEEFFRIERMFFMKGDTTINTTANSFKKQKIRFTKIEFEDNSSEILGAMHSDLNNVMNFLVDHPEFRLRISGHTDKHGNPAANMKLSQDRADAIRTYLTKSGFVDDSRVEAIGYGDTKPIVPEEKTEQDRQVNRRVEFELLYPDGKKAD
jgi:outer membrane protein OmpA-like peptidoglycan-associated protein/Tol biopolymer transport system component